MISDPNSISRIATGDHVDHSFFLFRKNGGRTEDFQKFTLQKQLKASIFTLISH